MGKVKGDKPPSGIEVFYDVRDGSYWYRLSGRYVALKKSDILMHFRAAGLREDIFFDGQREIDWPLYNSQLNAMIDYAGALAGHRVGIFKDGSNRKFLITDEAANVWNDLPKRAPEPKFFAAFIQELLPSGQWNDFCHWLAIALRSLRRGDFRPGQVVVLAGPSGCGKSLLQGIITEILGGRSANPFRYMMGLTQFNKDLCGAEHWPIEDPATTTDLRTRRQFGAMLKECTVNRDFSIHQKGKDAISLPIFRRVTISVNDEPENLVVVPPLDPSIQDKVFLFHCKKVVTAFHQFRAVDGTPTLLEETKTDGDVDRSAVWQHIMKEIPVIQNWLLQTFKAVGPDRRDDRFGIKAWHHPDLLAELVAFAPEYRLLNLIDEVLWADVAQGEPLVAWKGRAVELEKQLRASQFAFEVEKCLRHTNQAGSYLGKLAKVEPQRITRHVYAGYPSWEIKPPPALTEKKQ